MNLNQRLELQDRTIAALYRNLPLDRRIEYNEMAIQLLATKLNPTIAESLIRNAKIDALEAMGILPALEEADA